MVKSLNSSKYLCDLLSYFYMLEHDYKGKDKFKKLKDVKDRFNLSNDVVEHIEVLLTK